MNIECTDHISEFFDCAVNQILYLRHVYPPEDFINQQRYNLTLLHAVSSELKLYLEQLMVQVKRWVHEGVLSMLVLVITDIETGQVYERWTFCIANNSENKPAHIPSTNNHNQNNNNNPYHPLTNNNTNTPQAKNSNDNNNIIPLKKSNTNNNQLHTKSTSLQIQTVMKQIISSVSFLPQLPASSITFNVLAYTDKDATVPATWMDSDPRIIKNPQIVKLTPFSTENKSVQSLVAYRMMVDD